MTHRISLRWTRIAPVALVVAIGAALVGATVAAEPLAAEPLAHAAPAPITGINKPTTWSGSLAQPVAMACSRGAVWFADRANENQQAESLGTIDRITDSGYVEGWQVGLDPTSLTVGPDHNLWYGLDDGYIGRMSPTTHARRLFNTNVETTIDAITPGPGGLWFVGGGGNFAEIPIIGRITTKGKITIYKPKTLMKPVGLSVAGGSVWVLDRGGLDQYGNHVPASVLRVTPGQKMKRYKTPLLHDPGTLTMAITTGSDHALWIADGAILRLSTTGHWSGYGKVKGNAASPIVAGPDKALWYGDGSTRIGRITTGGHITHYVGYGTSFCFESTHTLWTARGNKGGVERITLPSKKRKIFRGEINSPTAVVSAAKSLWFTNSGSNSIGRFVPGKGAIFYSSRRISGPTDLTVGPDKALWFTNYNTNTIGRLSLTTHKLTTYKGKDIDQPLAITVGPDKALWFSNFGNTTIGRITVQGKVTHYSGTSAAVDVEGITTGPDGALWFVSNDQSAVLRMDPTTHHVTKLTRFFDEPTAIMSSGGYLWVTGFLTLYKINPSGGVATRNAPSGGDALSGLGQDAAGRIWFTAFPDDSYQLPTYGGVGVRATSTKVYFRHANNDDVGATAITLGPDGHMWFVSVFGGPGSISRVTTKS